MTDYTREQAIAEARRLSASGDKLIGNFAFLLVGGFMALGLGAIFLFLVAPGARLDEVETFRTWGTVLLVGGGIGVVTGWAMRTIALNGARRIYELSKQYDFDAKNLR